MPKILTGKVVSNKMQNAVVVRVTNIRLHPIYKKRIRKDKKIKASSAGLNIKVGDQVKIGKTRPISAQIHFKVLEVLK